MHVNFITIGNKKDVEVFISELNSKYLPFVFNNVDEKTGEFIKGTTANYHARILVRPIQLWDVVFPEPHKDLVLNTIFGDGEGKIHLHESVNTKKFERGIWALRKILGCSPMPEYKKDRAMPINKENLHVVAIGIKEDRIQDGKEML